MKTQDVKLFEAGKEASDISAFLGRVHNVSRVERTATCTHFFASVYGYGINNEMLLASVYCGSIADDFRELPGELPDQRPVTMADFMEVLSV